jgi:Asp-tRNA(Asn)/Glu-tRNA(Gln) amidotransferase A subunit family amidase
MHEDICFADATELARRIRDRELSPVEVMRAHLERIETINPKLNAIITLADEALDQARAAEQAVMRADPIGPLHGVPFTCKDSFDVAGVRTTRGSLLFEHDIAASDATAVARVKHAGGIFLGKTNTPEFTLWWETDNLVFGRTNNPWNTDMIPGGSSGGEAAALATGLTALGIGSDVGGSLRMPAHYCGVVGFKPTHGRVPLSGLFPETMLRTMHVGPLARTVRDAALAVRLMSGPDGTDPWCVPVEPPALPEPLAGALGLRVGWLADGAFAPVDAEVRGVVERAADALRLAGCAVEHVALPIIQETEALAIPAITGTPESGHYFEPFIRGREYELSPVMGRRLTAPWPNIREHARCMANWDALRRGMMAYFRTYDLLLCPTMPTPAYPHGQRELTIDGVTIKARRKLVTVVPWNLTGSPALSLPFGMSADGLPIGVQLVGRHFDEATVLRAAMTLEQVAEVRGIRPPVR